MEELVIFVANSLLCVVCRHSEDICQWSIDIEFFCGAVKQMHELDIENVTKTLFTSNQRAVCKKI